VITVAGNISTSTPLSGSHNLNATAASPATSIVNYAIYRQTGGTGNYQFFTSVASASFPYAVKIVGLLPNTQYSYQLYAISEGYVGPVSSTTSITTTATTSIVSIANGNWNDPAIWSPAQVPTSGDDVIISDTILIDATNGNAACKSLLIDGDGVVGFDDIATSGSLGVYGDATINGVFVARNSTDGGRTLAVAGNLTVGGEVDFVEPGATLTFFGIGNYSLTTTGTGAFLGTDPSATIPNTGVIRNLRINNSGNVTINKSIIVTEALQVTFGNLVTNGNITLDNTQFIGGITQPTSVTLTRSSNTAEIIGIFNVGTSAVYNVNYQSIISTSPHITLVAGNELNNTTVNALGVNNLTIANIAGVSYNGGNVLVKNTLNLSNHLYLGNSNITIGTSITNRGSVTQSNNSLIMTTGTVTRWLNATTNIVAGTALGVFPIGFNDQNRTFWIYGQPTSGGTISARYVDAPATSTLTTPFTENSVNYTVRTNSNWVVSTGNGLAATSLGIRLRAANIGGVTNVAQINLSLAGGVAPGAYSGGTFANAEPEGNRISLSDVGLNNTFYLAANGAVNPLPLRLLSFNGMLVNKDALLQWATCCEENIKEFSIERMLSGSDNWSNITTVAAKGNAIKNEYQLKDVTLSSGTWLYRLKIIEKNGLYHYSPVVAIKVNGTSAIVLHQNYPNPAKDYTVISYELSVKATVQLQVFDLLGKVVHNQFLGTQSAGYFNLTLNTQNYQAGLYVVKMNVMETETNKKYSLQNKMIVE
jgi:Secretion system C-terminal sorting domain